MVRAIAVGLLMGATAGCPGDDGPATGDDTGPSPSTSTSPAPDTDPTASPVPTTEGDTDAPAAWLEIGWGIDGFNAFDGTLPIQVGPQGLAMFSLPMRGAGFYNPPDPGFENPDMPMVDAWVDVDGFTGSPGGHLTEVSDYPALFYPSTGDPEVLEGPAMWLVLDPNPTDLYGRAASLHVQLVDTNGLALVQDLELVIGEAP